MRVGIITLYRGYNYGTSLQAYALKKYIASLGYDAKIIWTKENTTAGRDIRIGKIIRIVRRSCFRPKLFKHTFWGYKNSIAAEMPTSIKRKFLEFTQRELQVEGMSMRNLKKFASSEKTVAVVCGSDQIWSAAGANVEPLYFLRFVPREKRVAYAPSFGSSTVPSYNRNLLKRYLEDIPKISIREKQGAKIIEDLIGRTVPVVLDPTLLEKWDDIDEPLSWKNYVVAYFLSEPSENVLKSLKIAQEKYNCKIVSFPYKHPAYDELRDIEYPVVGPKEFVSIIKRARCVYTDSFHGTAFSINLHVPFWTFSRNYKGVIEQSSRITSLLRMMRLENQYISDQNIICKDIPQIDFLFAEQQLCYQRDISRQYLLNALSVR